MGVYTKFLWGPLCLLAAAATAKSSYNRHALQMLGSMAHIYGCLLYILTSWEEGHRHSEYLHISPYSRLYSVHLGHLLMDMQAAQSPITFGYILLGLMHPG